MLDLACGRGGGLAFLAEHFGIAKAVGVDFCPRSITFAAKSHHSGRCGRTLRKYFPNTQLNAWTHDAVHQGKTISLSEWHTHDEGRERVYGEYLRIQTYSERGDIATDM